MKTVKIEKIVKPVVPVPQRSQQGQNPQAGMPEKRKRGRPRKCLCHPWPLLRLLCSPWKALSPSLLRSTNNFNRNSKRNLSSTYSLRSRSSRCSTPRSPVPLLDLTILTIRIITLIRTDTLTTDKSSLPRRRLYLPLLLMR